MGADRRTELLELGRWIRQSRTDAERVLPDLLDLPPAAMSRELARHPDLRSGVIQLLLPLVRQTLELLPERVHQLTEVMVEHAELDVPSSRVPAARYLGGQAWTAHAAALHGLRKYTEARDAVAIALELFRREPAVPWYIATAEVVEAGILHKLGGYAEAVRQIQRAAGVILRYGDQQRYIQSRMSEAWMHCTAGNPAAAGEVWKAVAEEAVQRGDPLLEARLANTIGVFELRRGRAEVAARLFNDALGAFETAGLTREAAGARRNRAEAAVARGRFPGAINGYFTVRTELLRAGDVIGAALASVELLDLLFLAGRADQVPTLAEALVGEFAETQLRPNALQAWTFVRERAEAGELTRLEIADLRWYFQELPLRPNAPFLTLEEG